MSCRYGAMREAEVVAGAIARPKNRRTSSSTVRLFFDRLP
jgi:hypothetical protein